VESRKTKARGGILPNEFDLVRKLHLMLMTTQRGRDGTIEDTTMPRRKIIITETDRERLEALFASEFAHAIGPSDHLDDLRAELDRAHIVRPEDVPRNVVTMNSTISLRDRITNEKETYTLVFPELADIANTRLSVLAPIGTAILGQRLGDVLRWRVPEGWRRLKVEHIHYQPEREGIFHA
jgi:regulator of nucleoside diphosphate kinase